MIVCDCGRMFRQEPHFMMHKPHCKGFRRCQNPKCNIPLLKPDQQKFCSTRCGSLVTCPGRKHSKKTKQKISEANRKRYNSPSYEPSTCLFCDTSLPPKRKYCNQKCQLEHRYQVYIQKWKSGEVSGTRSNGGPSSYVRRYILEKYEYKCKECSWGIISPLNGKSPLNIHHIDGDDKNNNEENLEALCPNCHILTDNFGARNYYNNMSS